MPTWKAWCPDDTNEDGAVTYSDAARGPHYATDGYGAAEQHARQCMAAGEPFDEITICVSDGTAMHRFRVSVDYDPSFRARLLITSVGR